MKKFKYLLVMLFLCVPCVVNADKIYDVNMKINIDKNGTANVTEVWDVKASGGSEWYKAYENLENVEIENFKVSMDGKALKYKEWDVDESLREKKGYYGINETLHGVELCFGKYDHRRHKFTMTYTMSNFVFNTNDAQVSYFTLLPKADVKKFNVTITSFYSFPDSLDVWGYGYKGYAYVQNGKIVMTNEDGLDNEYVVLLAKFPQNTFETTNSYLRFTSFSDVLNMAKEGSFEHDYSNYGYNNNDYNDNDGIFDFIWTVLIIFLATGFSIKGVMKSGYGYKGNKIIDKKNTPMFRDIPCNKDIYYANALINLNNFSYKEANIFGAIILKWVKQNKIVFIKPKEGLFNSKTGSIDLRGEATFDNPLESELFSLMRAASGDGILEARELEKWCKRHYSKFLNLFDKIKNNEIDKLKAGGHIHKRISKEECKKKNVLDDYIYEDSVKLYGLKLYLEEFSRMDTKEVLEVHLWDEYLMFAYLFGIADKVSKQLKNLYPEVLENPYENNYVDYNTLAFINHISTSSVSAATSARNAAQSYSGGGGGFSSGGGGGGSFGGGGSMGGR